MITITRAVQTSMACPSQWDAWDGDGNYYYLRYRSGHGSVTQYEDENWADGPVQHRECIASFEYGHPLDGVISLEDFARLAGLTLSPDLVTTGFGDHMRDQLVTREGVDFGTATAATQPWRDLGE